MNIDSNQTQEIVLLPTYKGGMDRKERSIYVLSMMLGLGLITVFGVWWFQPQHMAQNFTGPFHVLDYILFAVLSYIVWHEIVMEAFSWYIAETIRRPVHCPSVLPGLRVAYLTAFVPGAEPYSVLEETLQAMVGVDYPHDTWLLDEGDDPLAKSICARLGVRHYSRKGKGAFNTSHGKFMAKTKGGNYNSWFHYWGTSYDIIAQHDMDFLPRKDFLLRTLGYFSDPRVAFVGTPQIYGNLSESWIARGAAEQTWGFYGPFQQGLYGRDMTLLIGANHLFRTEAMRDIGGYTAHIAEDMLTGMKVYTRPWTSVYVPESLLVGEGPTTWSAYFGQQMRWAYGCMDILFRHAPQLFSKMSWRRICNYLLLQQFYFGGVAQAAGIVLLTLYFFFGITPANLVLLPVLVLYVPLITFQILFQLWLQRFNVHPKNERGLLLRGRLLFIAAWPIFFLAFIGVLRNKRLTYVVTPKGDKQLSTRTPDLFVPHLILGSITLCDLIIGVKLGHTSGPMIFWAALNTFFMCGFFLWEAVPEYLASLGRGIYAIQARLRRPIYTALLLLPPPTPSQEDYFLGSGRLQNRNRQSIP
ncbi:MAG: glycosyltransferase [Patescibacteria group bacterium]|nr:glycosyltransferase [Patescibacteria group bacterium]